MRIRNGLMAIAAALAVTACGSDVPPPDKLDEFAWMDTMTFGTPVASALEAGYMEEPIEEAEEPEPAPAPRATPVRRASSTRSTGTYTPAPAPAPVRTEKVTHVGRDAAIGAAGGAVIGAIAGGSRHRVRGAIIGGAAGAVLGGVIGATIDTETRPVRQYYQ
ncbi:MAG TPA: YMGG-like glycine zipper-containing protein [Longimicrobiales bacterium]